MTFRRVLNRNRLAEGDYDPIPTSQTRVAQGFPDAEKFNEGVNYVGVLRSHIDSLNAELDAADRARRLLLGDLRRLERDSVDENAVCRHVAAATGIDAEVVAAVLKEYVAL